MAQQRSPRNNGNGRVPPHNLDAEESTLGACLLSAQARDDVLPLVAVKDFYKPAHQFVFDAIRAMHTLGKPVDIITVSNELQRAGLLDEIGGMEFLSSLANATPVISNATRYADIVGNTARQRAIISLSADAIEAAYSEAPLAETIAETKAKLDEVDLVGRSQVAVVRGEVALAEPPAPYDWVMPHVLERDDRLMITGGEGAKKSMLMLQLAVMSASGMHWFAPAKVRPRRVLFVDAELGIKRTRRRIELHTEEAGWSDDSWFENLVLYSKSADIDITTRAGASWLASIFDMAQPDIAFIGPVYRLMSGRAEPGDIGGEDQAKRAAFALDKIRERFNCAMVLETHAAKGENGRGRDLRPFGSSVWTRWPEFGYGLVRQDPNDVNFHPDNRDWVAWRGDRDPREWPKSFHWQTDGWRMKAHYESTPVWWSQVMTGRTPQPRHVGPSVDANALDQF